MDTTLAQLVALGQVDSEARGWCDYLARQLASNLVIVMVAAAAAAAAVDGDSATLSPPLP